MKIPKQIKIGPFLYEIEFSKDIATEGDCYGSTHNGNQKIFLQPDLKKQFIEENFIHEILHAIMFVHGINRRFDDKNNKPTGEDVVKAIASLLYGIIKDNPGVFK